MLTKEQAEHYAGAFRLEVARAKAKIWPGIVLDERTDHKSLAGVARDAQMIVKILTEGPTDDLTVEDLEHDLEAIRFDYIRYTKGRY